MSIITYSGRWINPFFVLFDEICIEDIAHSEALTCRFGGHSRVFYSVAQHSVILSGLVAPQNALWALLHDAAEAYLGDVVRPIKAATWLTIEHDDAEALVRFATEERRLLEEVSAAFQLPWPIPAEVETADNRILVNELQELLPTISYEGLPPPFPARPLCVPCWTPAEAEERFLARFRELSAGD